MDYDEYYAQKEESTLEVLWLLAALAVMVIMGGVIYGMVKLVGWRG